MDSMRENTESASKPEAQVPVARLMIRSSVTVHSLGGGIYQVNDEPVAGAAKMLAAVSAALGIEPTPRASREPKAAKPAKAPKAKAE